MVSRQLFTEDKRKKLRIFDFDDTLVKTKAKVYVTNKKTGKTFSLTPGEYAVYKPRPTDEFDYHEFNRVIDPTEIKEISQILRRVVKKSRDTVFILTARGAYRPVREYLRDIGINTNQIYVQSLASGDPQDKVDWIEGKIDNEGYNDIYFADDSPKNVKAVKNMLRKKDGLERWRVQHVKY